MSNHTTRGLKFTYHMRCATSLVVLIMVAFVAPLNAQLKDINGSLVSPSPEVKQARAAVDDIAFLVGEWKGAGWVVEGPGKRSAFQQTEIVQKWANGTALLIQGEGSVPDSATGQLKVVFQAAGLLAYDTRSSSFSMLNASGTGQILSHKPEVSANRLVWGFEVPGGMQIRYVITLTSEGRWHEIGEMTRDGERWNQFFFMELERTK